MKRKKVLNIMFVLVFSFVLVLNLHIAVGVNGISDTLLINLEKMAMAENDPYQKGFPGTNWRGYTIKCKKSEGYNVNLTIPIKGVPVGGSYHKEVTSEYDAVKCGYGAGTCWNSGC